MGDPQKNAEMTLPKEPVLVIVDGNHLGHEMKNRGDEFNLKNVFSPESAILGGDRFSEVYIRTDSENIYFLDDQHDHAELTNRNVSLKTGNRDIVNLEREELAKRTLKVGEPFIYGKGGTTTNITEIVATNRRVYYEDYLKGITRGRVNLIVNDFKAGLPAPKIIPQI